MKLAIVHDALVNRGGAERVLGNFHELFPEAPIYTSVYLQGCTHSSLDNAEIRTTYLQHFVRTEAQLKMLFPLTFSAMRRLDLSNFDVVLTSSTYCAKNVETGGSATHVCYCYAPFRPVWEFEPYTANLGWSRWRKSLLGAAFECFRQLDLNAAQKARHMVAISRHAARKIARSYGRKPAAIIYPPVDVSGYRCEPSQGYYLVVSRLAAYKRIDIVVSAFNAMKYPLKIVGTGPELGRLRAMAGPSVEFLGALSESELRSCYARCRCLVFPGEEDFGLTPLEAHASGKPVIAFAGGGALETIVGADEAADPGEQSPATGVFFHEQTPRAVVDAVRLFETLSFDPCAIRDRALLFDKSKFKQKIQAFLQQAHSGSLVPEMWAGTELANSAPAAATRA
jgi:glycosyltransferase involved in cell wall biosynthesis